MLEDTSASLSSCTASRGPAEPGDWSFGSSGTARAPTPSSWLALISLHDRRRTEVSVELCGRLLIECTRDRLQKNTRWITVPAQLVRIRSPRRSHPFLHGRRPIDADCSAGPKLRQTTIAAASRAAPRSWRPTCRRAWCDSSSYHTFCDCAAWESAAIRASAAAAMRALRAAWSPPVSGPRRDAPAPPLA